MTDYIYTTNTYYTDNQFTIDPKNGDDIVEYWVKAKITQSQLSLESNHRSTEGISQIQWKISNEEEIVLDKSELFSNYPNPFNPSTSIQYAIVGKQFVSLKIYDVIGNEVTTLVNEWKEAGSYKVEFNASSVSGKLVSGIYFYRLQAGTYCETKKMVLLE